MAINFGVGLLKVSIKPMMSGQIQTEMHIAIGLSQKGISLCLNYTQIR